VDKDKHVGKANGFRMVVRKPRIRSCIVVEHTIQTLAIIDELTSQDLDKLLSRFPNSAFIHKADTPRTEGIDALRSDALEVVGDKVIRWRREGLVLERLDQPRFPDQQQLICP